MDNANCLRKMVMVKMGRIVILSTSMLVLVWWLPLLSLLYLVMVSAFSSHRMYCFCGNYSLSVLILNVHNVYFELDSSSPWKCTFQLLLEQNLSLIIYTYRYSTQCIPAYCISYIIWLEFEMLLKKISNQVNDFVYL